MRFFFVLFFSLLFSPLALAETSSCGHPDKITISYTDSTDLEHACNAYSQVVELFNHMGFSQKTPFKIVFQDVVYLPSKQDQPMLVAGLYIHNLASIDLDTLDFMANKGVRYETRTSYLMSYHSQITQHKTSFSLPYTDELHTSVILHEMTHAIDKDQYETTPESVVIDEYIAYSLQIASLSEQTRRKILTIYSEPKFSAWKQDSLINPLLYAFDPHGFGVISYRHFNGARGGAPYLKKIYAGKIGELTMD